MNVPPVNINLSVNERNLGGQIRSMGGSIGSAVVNANYNYATPNAPSPSSSSGPGIMKTVSSIMSIPTSINAGMKMITAAFNPPKDLDWGETKRLVNMARDLQHLAFKADQYLGTTFSEVMQGTTFEFFDGYDGISMKAPDVELMIELLGLQLGEVKVALAEKTGTELTPELARDRFLGNDTNQHGDNWSSILPTTTNYTDNAITRIIGEVPTVGATALADAQVVEDTKAELSMDSNFNALTGDFLTQASQSLTRVMPERLLAPSGIINLPGMVAWSRHESLERTNGMGSTILEKLKNGANRSEMERKRNNYSIKLRLSAEIAKQDRPIKEKRGTDKLPVSQYSMNKGYRLELNVDGKRAQNIVTVSSPVYSELSDIPEQATNVVEASDHIKTHGIEYSIAINPEACLVRDSVVDHLKPNQMAVVAKRKDDILIYKRYDLTDRLNAVTMEVEYEFLQLGKIYIIATGGHNIVYNFAEWRLQPRNSLVDVENIRWRQKGQELRLQAKTPTFAHLYEAVEDDETFSDPNMRPSSVVRQLGGSSASNLPDAMAVLIGWANLLGVDLYEQYEMRALPFDPLLLGDPSNLCKINVSDYVVLNSMNKFYMDLLFARKYMAGCSKGITILNKMLGFKELRVDDRGTRARRMMIVTQALRERARKRQSDRIYPVMDITGAQMDEDSIQAGRMKVCSDHLSSACREPRTLTWMEEQTGLARTQFTHPLIVFARNKGYAVRIIQEMGDRGVAKGETLYQISKVGPEKVLEK